MGVNGSYVEKFTDATHALPDGMHMNANYPFMIPKVASVVDGVVTLVSDRTGERRECKIVIRRKREACEVEQSSSYETLFRLKPTKWVFYPFKGTQT